MRRCALFVLAARFLTAAPFVSNAPTFNRDIAPLVFQYCSPCHHPGETAPFSLLTYSDARRHASRIAAVTHAGYMPPWPPQPQPLAFAGTRRLSPAQRELIAAWVRAGSPEGDAASLPPAPVFSAGWQLGPPDLVVQVPRPFVLSAGGGDVFRNFVVPVHVAAPTYIRAVEIRPGDRRLIHHANIVVDRARSLRARDGLDGQPGFPGMDVTTESGDTFEPDSHFLFWKPGSVPETAPPGMAWRLDPDTDLILNLHLQPSGKAETVQPMIGLYYSPQAPRRFPMLLQLEHDNAIDIPPGTATFFVTDHLTLPAAVDVLRIYPHAHYLGKRVEAWAALPNGSRLQLIAIADWDINWQAVYTYREPVHLPKGTVVSMRISYDNTAANPRNPHHPPERVRGGNRGEDEMGHVWLQVVSPLNAPDARGDLQEAVMSRRLEKDPADFIAHYNLGALLQSRGDTTRAMEQYQAALRLEPNHVAARNALASAFAVAGLHTEAIREWRETVRLQPLYSMARFNLAHALASAGDAAGAISEYAAYLRQQPNDAQAHLELGAIYISLHRYAEALPEYRRASELKPGDADALTNFGTLLAKSGDLAAAIQAFQAALQADPSNPVARANLDRARASEAK